jgi:putative Holliday junction resolvase
MLMERYLGIDLGEKRVGLAISDPTLTIAQPFKTLQFTKFTKFIQDIQGIIDELHISKIIVGLPLTLKGTFSQKTHEVMEIVEKMRKKISVPMVTFDERLTTVQAYQTMHQMEIKPSRKRDKVDQLAAVHLLQNYLNQESYRRKSNGN